MGKIRLVTMSRGKITASFTCNEMFLVNTFLRKTFPDREMLRYNDHELVFKSGNDPITIIVAPIRI